MPATTRRPSAERREQIALAVLRIVGDGGVSALSTTTLAAEIGLTSGALFRHFASRDEILDAAVRHAVRRIEETFPDSSLPPLERLMQLAQNRVALLGSDRGLAWLLRSEPAYHALPARAVKHLRDLVKRSERFLLDAMREGAEQGTIRNDIEPEVLVVVVAGTVHALIGMPGVHRSIAPARRRDPNRVLLALELMLKGTGGTGARKPRTKNETRNC
jgi:AcrR family transcriptional regulator